MKLTPEQIAAMKGKDTESSLQKLAATIEKMVSASQQDGVGLRDMVKQQTDAIVKILSQPQQQPIDYKSLAATIAASLPTPKLPEVDNGLAKSIEMLAQSIANKPSQFSFDVQRKSTGEIHRVIVKPYNENGSV